MTKRIFDTWWYSAGTPTFAIQTLKRRGLLPIDLENLVIDSNGMISSRVDEISTGALLLQSGYMTISGEVEVGGSVVCNLEYPNSEVRVALNKSILYNMLLRDNTDFQRNSLNLLKIMKQGNTAEMEKMLHSVFSGIPHQWHLTGQSARYESYFASVIYGYFAGMGLDVRVEDSTSLGRVDMTLIMEEYIYLFEFKMAGSSETGGAIEQILEKEYADKYLRQGIPIVLVGIEFNKDTRNIENFDAVKH